MGTSAAGPTIERKSITAVTSATRIYACRTLATLQKRELVETEHPASAATAVGGGSALAAKSFINGEGEGGGVVMCNRDTDGASVDGERVGGVEAGSVRGVVGDDIVSF